MGVVLFIILIAGVSYAWFTWTSTNVNIQGTTECFNVNYSHGQVIDNASVILFDENKIISNNKVTVKNGMAMADVTAYMDSNCNIAANIELILDVTDLNNAYISGQSVGAFKYVLASYDPSVYTDVTVTSLNGTQLDIVKKDSITSTGSITLVDEVLTSTKKGYIILFYVDGDLAMNDAEYSTFSATISGVATQTE